MHERVRKIRKGRSSNTVRGQERKEKQVESEKGNGQIKRMGRKWS
jgi:hypothetical protein